MMPRSERPPRSVIALVHHANQHLVTDGYTDREGITELADGYAAVLRLHEEHGIPANLHLSGTLVEALAWYRPALLQLIRELVQKGVVGLLGGTYAENVMPLFSADVNRRQLDEALGLYERLLGCPPERMRAAWVPERVWQTAALAPVLTSAGLRNGGYRYVLLDDRLLFSTDGPGGRSPRELFDTLGPYAVNVGAYGETPGVPDQAGRPPPVRELLREARRCYRIAGGSGLAVVPISARLRYLIPPRTPDHWRLLEAEIAGEDGPSDGILVYADDLEKTAGVGPWEKGVDAYGRFLAWLAERAERIPAVLLDEWLPRHPPAEERVLDPGTFFELARAWRAGEDYRGWSESLGWVAYAGYLSAAESALRAAGRARGDVRLLDLGWKHLLASGHETAWHDVDADGSTRGCAHWARAIASHARACLPIAAAARWFGAEGRTPRIDLEDVDADGETELVLRNEELLAVLTPRHGGRLVYLFARACGGAVLVVGNPTDHWNWQEELNRYMEVPANHPGAFADAGFELDAWRVTGGRADDEHAIAEMKNVQPGSLLFGARKRVLLPAGSAALLTCYELPAGVHDLATEVCVSPDYGGLLREGRRVLVTTGGDTWRSARHGGAEAWVALAADERTVWEPAARATNVGHGVTFRLRAAARHFHLLLGCGEMDEGQRQTLLQRGREVLHRKAPRRKRARVS